MQTNDHVINTKKMQYLLSNDNLQKFNEPLPYCNRLLLLYKQRILCRVDPNTYTPTYTLAGSVARALTLLINSAGARATNETIMVETKSFPSMLTRI